MQSVFWGLTMGIRFYCPNGHKLNVKEFQAGQRGICPRCHAKFDIPFESTRPAGSKDLPIAKEWEERAKREGLFPFEKKSEPIWDDIDLNHVPMDWNAVPDAGNYDSQEFSGTSSTSTFQNSYAADTEINAKKFNASLNLAEPPKSVQTPTPTLPDPFEGPADTVWYLHPTSGNQIGPVNRDTMRTWLNENRIAPDSLVWREGWPDWKTASDVFESLASPKNTFGF